MSATDQKLSNGPLVYRGTYQHTYGPKTQVLRAIGPSPSDKRPQNVQNERGEYKRIVAKPYYPVQHPNPSKIVEEDVLDEDIREIAERIEDKTTVQSELNGMEPVTFSHRKECKSARISSELDREELDLLRENSLRGRRSTRAGREEPASDWRDQEDYIPGESIDWIFKEQ